MKCTALLKNAIIYEYQFRTISEYVVKMLTFVNGKCCSEILATRSLVQIDEIKEKMIIYEF